MTASPMTAVQIELANPATRLRPILMGVWRCACGKTSRPAAPWRTSFPPSFSPVAILVANDVVFPEIAAGLNLDQKQGGLPRVLETVLRADRDVGGLVFREQLDFLVARNPRGARHHDPVLRPVVMHLQRKSFARLDHDALDLKAVAGVDAFVVA